MQPVGVNVAHLFPCQLALLRPPLFGRALEGQHRTAAPPVALAGRRRTAEGLEHSLASLRKTSGVVQIDVENVRGNTGFRVDHGTVVAALACWAREWDLRGRVVLAVDHGTKQNSFYLPMLGLGFVFAGPSIKADDILVEAVRRRVDQEAVPAAGLRKVGKTDDSQTVCKTLPEHL